MDKVQVNVTLGPGEKGRRRQAVLEEWAINIGATHGGKPSISKLIQKLADQKIMEVLNELSNL